MPRQRRWSNGRAIFPRVHLWLEWSRSEKAERSLAARGAKRRSSARSANNARATPGWQASENISQWNVERTVLFPTQGRSPPFSLCSFFFSKEVQKKSFSGSVCSCRILLHWPLGRKDWTRRKVVKNTPCSFFLSINICYRPTLWNPICLLFHA